MLKKHKIIIKLGFVNIRWLIKTKMLTAKPFGIKVHLFRNVKHGSHTSW